MAGTAATKKNGYSPQTVTRTQTHECAKTLRTGSHLVLLFQIPVGTILLTGTFKNPLFVMTNPRSRRLVRRPLFHVVLTVRRVGCHV